MKCQHFLLSEATGKYLCADFSFGRITLPRGRQLTAEDIKLLKSCGLKTVLAADFEEGDVISATALEIIAVRLCGENTAYCIGDDGLCKIIATQDGILMRESERVAKFNHIQNELILNTIPAWYPVKKGEIIAEVELLTPALSQTAIDNVVLHLSGNVPMLSIQHDYPKKTAFIYASLQNNMEQTEHFTAQVTELIRTLEPLNLSFEGEYQASYDVEDLADAIQTAEYDGCELIFIISPVRTITKDDVIPTAMSKFVDKIVNFDIPSINSSDLIIATKRASRIIALPYNFAKHNSPRHYQDICKAIIHEKLNAFDFQTDECVSLFPAQSLSKTEETRLIDASSTTLDPNASQIAIVILAAGSSARAKCNKLLKDCGGEPLFMKAVHAALKSKGLPVFFITGHQHEVMEELLKDVDINVVYNSDYRAGVKTSIKLGLNLVPNSCQGAILLPADMPNITENELNKLIAEFDNKLEKQVIMLTSKNIKKNPILWSRSLFADADLVPENTDVRGAFLEHTDYTTLIKIPNDNTVWDITFPADIDKLKEQ